MYSVLYCALYAVISCTHRTYNVSAFYIQSTYLHRIHTDSVCVVQVLCVFLFHELPPEVRRAASREMARVLKPGGLLILTDSIQLGDRLPLDEGLGKFFDFNEPFYKTYIAEDLGKMLSDCGLECDEKLLASSSKVLSFRKPM